MFKFHTLMELLATFLVHTVFVLLVATLFTFNSVNVHAKIVCGAMIIMLNFTQ